MKLKYFWLGLAFIVPSYGSSKCVGRILVNPDETLGYKISIPCEISDSEDYFCSNETEFQKVCRGITVTTSTCKKCVSIPMTLWVLQIDVFRK